MVSGIRIAASCCLLVLALAACNPAAEQEPDTAAAVGNTSEQVSGEIQVWGLGTEDVVGSSRVTAFEEAFPDVQVSLTPGDFDEQKFLSAVASGNPPDVVHIPRDEVGSYAARGALQPLDDAIAAGGMDTSVFYEPALADVQYEGQVYGIPQFNNITVAYLNNPVLEEAGMAPADVDLGDWDALIGMQEQLTEAQGGRVRQLGFDAKVADYFPLYLAANGGAVLSEDGAESLLDTPESVEVATLAQRLAEAGGGDQQISAFTTSWDIFGEGNPIASEQVGATMFEQWYAIELANVSPDVDLTLAPLQTTDGEPISFAGGLALAVPQGAQNPAAGYAFSAFMAEEETWLQAAQAAKRDTEDNGGIYTGTYTGNRAADERIFSEVYEPSGNAVFDDAVQVVRDAQESAISVPANAAGAEIKQVWTDAINNVLVGRASPEEAMAEADAAAQEALDRAQQ